MAVTPNDPLTPLSVSFHCPAVEPHDDPSRVIGRRTTYRGTEHPYLLNHVLVVVAVLKDALRTEDYAYLATEDEIRAAGGVSPFDRVEVSPWMPEAGRPSFATSDPKAVDLEAFALG